jgi:hypothetical protein
LGETLERIIVSVSRPPALWQAAEQWPIFVEIDDRSPPMPLDDKTRTELEAAVYRRLVAHLRARTDVQNIDLMNLAGFCRNCLSNWMKDAADEKGIPMSKDESREIVYGMPYDEWRAKHQTEASPAQKAAFEKAKPSH